LRKIGEEPPTAWVFTRFQYCEKYHEFPMIANYPALSPAIIDEKDFSMV
jgi:hypothetical protein